MDNPASRIDVFNKKQKVIKTASNNLAFVLDIGAQVSVSHEGQDDHRLLIVAEAEPDQGKDVRVVKVLHDDALLQETLHQLVVEILL